MLANVEARDFIEMKLKRELTEPLWRHIAKKCRDEINCLSIEMGDEWDRDNIDSLIEKARDIIDTWEESKKEEVYGNNDPASDWSYQPDLFQPANEPVKVSSMKAVLCEKEAARWAAIHNFVCWRLSQRDSIRHFRAFTLADISFRDFLADKGKYAGDDNSVLIKQYSDEYREFLVVYGDSLFQPEEAVIFLDSFANKCLSPEVFRQLGLNFRTCSSECVRYESESLPNNTIEIDAAFLLKDEDCEHLVPFHVVRKNNRALELSYGDETVTMTTSVEPGSVLGDLSIHSDNLSRFLDWPQEEAVWFILTGESPGFTPAKAESELGFSIHRYKTKIELTVEAWVSPSTVKRLYQEQRKKLNSKISVAQISDERIALFNFLVDQEKKGRIDLRKLLTPYSRLDWRYYMEVWNQGCSTAWKETNSKRFGQNCVETLRAMLWKKEGDKT
jgi:hypothetical protein